LGVKPEIGQWKWKRDVAIEAVENYKEYQRKFENKMTLEEYWEKTGKTKKFIRRRTDLLTGKNKGVEHWVSPSEGVLVSTNWYDLLASETLKEFGLTFDNPKNRDVIKRILELSTNERAIILDSFAGSATTAHAVLALNKEDGGNRKFVMVECEDYANEITAERVRRVIKGVKNAKDENLRQGLGGTFSYFELGDSIEMESILEGDKLPSYLELARYVFYTATGEEFDTKKVDEKKNFIGESKEYEVYLFYKPDMDYLKSTALTLERAKGLGPHKGKKRLVFAPSKYLDTDYLLEYRIDYCQLPFEIYKLKE
ncbi:MAG: site-specific DNA-methyltransferase, partial [candidate division Zixibacteria bacterium]|nr:site-specific DNA-methyltransferase [candidate division Zixibacteria bacterium]